MELADFLIGTAIAVVGLYLTHSLRRQQRLRVAEKRLDAYRKLWAPMELARPTRVKKYETGAPLTRDEAKKLYRQTTDWYYGDGNGMLMTEPTKRLYLHAKDDLGLYADGTDPEWQPEGERVTRELSLLRTQMKLDLDIYGRFREELDAADRAFLERAGFNPDRWSRPSLWQKVVSRVRGTP